MRCPIYSILLLRLLLKKAIVCRHCEVVVVVVVSTVTSIAPTAPASLFRVLWRQCFIQSALYCCNWHYDDGATTVAGWHGSFEKGRTSGLAWLGLHWTELNWKMAGTQWPTSFFSLSADFFSVPVIPCLNCLSLSLSLSLICCFTFPLMIPCRGSDLLPRSFSFSVTIFPMSPKVPVLWLSATAAARQVIVKGQNWAKLLLLMLLLLLLSDDDNDDGVVVVVVMVKVMLMVVRRWQVFL